MANDTRTRMLDATAKLLRQRGYHGTSLNDILAASGAPRGSLYFHFPGGKDQLVIEVTRASVAGVAERLRETLTAENKPGVAIRNIFAEIARMLDENFALGCPVAPVVLDGTSEVPELIELSRQAFEQWIGLFQEAFVRAGIPDKRARTLALLVESSIEGLMIIARTTRDSSALLSVADELAELVEAAGAKSRR
jgi:TetR/AcrR family transcriptional regulator, lmrAB and yxaGH operons repressor